MKGECGDQISLGYNESNTPKVGSGKPYRRRGCRSFLNEHGCWDPLIRLIKFSIHFFFVMVVLFCGALVFAILEDPYDPSTASLNETESTPLGKMNASLFWKGIEMKYNINLSNLNTRSGKLLLDDIEMYVWEENARKEAIAYQEQIRDRLFNFKKWLYFMTICSTTIGYGDIYPKTDNGKIFFMCICIFAIVLMMTLLMRCGDLITIFNTTCFDFIRRHSCRNTKSLDEQNSELVKIAIRDLLLGRNRKLVSKVLLSGIDMKLIITELLSEINKKLDSGDLLSSGMKKSVSKEIHRSENRNSISEELLATHNKELLSETEPPCENMKSISRELLPGRYSKSFSKELSELIKENNSKLVSAELLSVISVTLTTFGFLCCGVVYCKEHIELSLLDSVYLFIVTFTTIGFGDISFPLELEVREFIILAVYRLIGLAFVAGVIDSVYVYAMFRKKMFQEGTKNISAKLEKGINLGELGANVTSIRRSFKNTMDTATERV